MLHQSSLGCPMGHLPGGVCKPDLSLARPLSWVHYVTRLPSGNCSASRGLRFDHAYYQTIAILSLESRMMLLILLPTAVQLSTFPQPYIHTYSQKHIHRESNRHTGGRKKKTHAKRTPPLLWRSDRRRQIFRLLVGWLVGSTLYINPRVNPNNYIIYGL